MVDASADALGLELPPGWQLRETVGPLGFRTRARLIRPDGTEVAWSSRRHRKGLAPLAGRSRRVEHPRDLVAGSSPTSRLLGGLFMVGAACFAFGSVPSVVDGLDPQLVAWVFFVGSIFFTSAAYVQFRESVVAPTTVDPAGVRARGLRGLVGWRPRSLGWWSTAVQLVGTVLFNVSTFAATRDALTLRQEREWVWAPDVGGSVCFLVASWLAYVEVAPRALHPPRRDLGVHIAAMNLLGSVAFGVAAIAARYVASTSEPANPSLVGAGTFVGAVLFFGGAALLPVESATDRVHEQPDPAAV